MARHIYIGTSSDQVGSYSSGLLGSGAIDVQKVSLSGPTSMAPGDVRTNTEQFRIVQGTGTVNIVSPWIYGDDVINWDGKTYTAAVGHAHTITWGGTTTAAGSVSIKFVRTDQPAHEAFHLDVAVPTATAAAAVDALVQTAYAAATVPDWLATTCTAPGTSNVFTGASAATVGDSGAIWQDNPPTFVVSVTNTIAGLTATWTTDSAPTTSASAGHGDGWLVRKIEEQWWGNQFGTYDRAGIVNGTNPTNYSVVATNYDMYSIAATKDGSSQSQVHGVDNIMEIAVAITDGSGGGFEAQLNPYMNDCGFASVVI